MTVKSYWRGHEIQFENNEWVYSDTKEPTLTTHHMRACGHCNMFATPEGHDACLWHIAGVRNACCGHGNVKEAYVQFLDSSSVEGEDAIKIMDVLKNYGEDGNHV